MVDYLISWPHLTKGMLIARYKRFLADIKLEDGRIITSHCPNSGRMLGCSEPGRDTFLSLSGNTKRSYPFTLELIDMPSSLVAVNTLRANQIVGSAIQKELIPELSGHTSLKMEVNVGDHSRIDMLLEDHSEARTLVEVKSCTYAEKGRVMFPDAVTERGLRHLKELQRALEGGFRCVMFFLVQRMDAQVFTPADHIDPAYGLELRRAADKGVEILVYSTEIDLRGIALGKRIPCLI